MTDRSPFPKFTDAHRQDARDRLVAAAQDPTASFPRLLAAATDCGTVSEDEEEQAAAIAIDTFIRSDLFEPCCFGVSVAMAAGFYKALVREIGLDDKFTDEAVADRPEWEDRTTL